MAPRGKRGKPKKPRFPRRRWLPGQAPRIEKPRKGKGSYDRSRQGRDARRQAAEDLGEG
ncbi:MAG: ribosome alternative rescue factor ArfA [Planctomycetes bacterium]|nr:ribosome alternative rescue factor ArfA [Planctomycetota bacterium]